MRNLRTNKRGVKLQYKQKGVATLLTVVLMLLMMTIIALYGTKIGVFEQMASANDTRQKQAFHAAEAGINIFIERVRANLNDVLSSDVNGWFAPASLHWLPCPGSPAATHPCYAEKDTDRRANSFYFVEDAADDTDTVANLGVNPLPAEQSVEVSAVVCPLDVDYSGATPNVLGCKTTPDSEMLITLVSRGTSDNGRGQAVVKQVFADFDLAGGVPGVPLTAPFVGLPTGTADIVANPNGGGEGVPLSVWSAGDYDENGGIRTCEAYEFYDQQVLPADINCPGCDCEAGAELSSKFTRYSDIRDNDPKFPDDLFEYFFGIPKEKYSSVKNSMENVTAAECGDFDGTASGAYWVNGGCTFGGGGNDCQIGTQDTPVFLVISGDFVSHGCDVFGLIFVTDAENVGAGYDVTMNGNATAYGAIMVDHDTDKLNGTFAIVYNEDVLKKANKFNGIAAMPGGWSDFL